MHMDQPIGNVLASALHKIGVAVTCNPLMWSELSNFIDHKFCVIKPVAVNPVPQCDDNWEIKAAFSCIDKFLFREKMLFACIIGDETIHQLEEQVRNVQMNAGLTEQPPEVGFVQPADHYERIPTDVLRVRKTMNPMSFVDFDAISPKPTRKIDRLWYGVGCREIPSDEPVFQANNNYLTMCGRVLRSKVVR